MDPCWFKIIPRLVPKALRSLVVRTNGGSNWKFESQNGPLEVFHQAEFFVGKSWDGIDGILSSPSFTPKKSILLTWFLYVCYFPYDINEWEFDTAV